MDATDIENRQWKLAADLVNHTHESVFLTGKAGTGKTTFLKSIVADSFKNAAIVAPTGVAAMNAGGTTIHSFFGLPFSPFVPGTKKNSGDYSSSQDLISKLRLGNEKKQVITELDLLIIDEISMVRCDVLDAMDLVLRHTRLSQEPFGGVQILFIGDLYQLPPVVKQSEWPLLSSVYTSPFFFSSQVIQKQPPAYIELEKVYRQRDEDFIHLLNMVRNNQMTKESYHALHERLIPADDDIITLTTHNHKADTINRIKLDALPGVERKFYAAVDGIFPENSYPADEILCLKTGARVMFLKNDTEKIRRYYNGKIGTIKSIADDEIVIECDCDGIPVNIPLKKDSWKNNRYVLEKGKVVEETLGTFTQFPLRLAWAITIHKSQGLTFEKVKIDAAEAFAPGQVYVALSRCTNLEGLFLTTRISYQSLKSDERIVSFSEEMKTATNIQEKVQEKISYNSQQLIIQLFDMVPIHKKSTAFGKWCGMPAHFKNLLDGWLNEIESTWEKVNLPSANFLGRIRKTAFNAENKTWYDERVPAAVNYFVKELESLKVLLEGTPAVTDNRKLGIDFENRLGEIITAITKKVHLLKGVSDGFEIEKYYRNKAAFTEPVITLSISANAKRFDAGNGQSVLIKTLLEQRDYFAKKKGIPIYMVCGLTAIHEMASKLPLNETELSCIKGFGAKRAANYGKEFLDIINDFCESQGITADNRPAIEIPLPKKERKPKKEKSHLISYRLYQEGKSIEEIARERNFALSTIESHLAQCIEENKLDIKNFLNNEKLQLIKDAHGKLKTGTISELKELVPDISYGELRYYLAGINSANG